MQRSRIVWTVIVAVASIVCWRAAQSAPINEDDAELYRLFVDVLESVDRSYVREVNRRELVEAAINGMLRKLDPHSNFITRDDFNRFERETTGHFGGIGISIEPKPEEADFIVVSSPLYDTPAYRAGIIAGDRILKVNGETVKGLTQEHVVERISGPAGTEVTISLSHAPHKNPPIDVKLVRETIKYDTVHGDHRKSNDQWDYFVDTENKIGYVRVGGFSQTTPNDLEKTLKQLLAEGMKGLVLDLRYNPGGLLTSAVRISDLFVAKGRIVNTKGRNTVERPIDAVEVGTLPVFPMAILVNEFSASASEIVAACLQDHERAIVVGERTFGKGSVQNVIELEGGKTALKLTTAAYRRPNGKNIHRFPDAKESDDWGVRPNEGYEIKFNQQDHTSYWNWRRNRERAHGKENSDQKPAETPKEFKDTQLAKAVDYVREKVAKSHTKVAAAKPESR